MEIALFITIWKYVFWLSHIYTLLGSLLLLGIATGTIWVSKKYYFIIKFMVLNTVMIFKSTR